MIIIDCLVTLNKLGFIYSYFHTWFCIWFFNFEQAQFSLLIIILILLKVLFSFAAFIFAL